MFKTGTQPGVYMIDFEIRETTSGCALLDDSRFVPYTTKLCRNASYHVRVMLCI